MVRTLNLLTVLLVLSLATVARAEQVPDAAQLFAQGQARLATADFDGALDAIEAAARDAPDNEHYKAELVLLRRVMMLRSRVSEESDAVEWDRLARALRAYYYDHAVFEEALRLDRTRFERGITTESVSLLAETLLELGRNAEALQAIEAAGEAAASPRPLRFKGIALAREKDIEAAKALLARCAEVTEREPQGHLELARLYALLGDETVAAAEVAHALQRTPPSRLAMLRQKVTEHPDFSGMITTRSFAVALESESEVKESSCSSGKSCGACPSRSTCGTTP